MEVSGIHSLALRACIHVQKSLTALRGGGTTARDRRRKLVTQPVFSPRWELFCAFEGRDSPGACTIASFVPRCHDEQSEDGEGDPFVAAAKRHIAKREG